MGIKRFRPTSPGRRFMTVETFEDITRSEPERSLVAPLKKNGGRNNYGRITTRHQGGGHKRRYRIIDFKRDKDGVPAKVAHIEYDPNRSARIALLHYADGEKRYILAPQGCKVGDVVESGPAADIKSGNALPLENIPSGTTIHNIELQPGRGGQLVRSAGTSAQLQAKEGGYGVVRLPSGELRRIRLTLSRDRRRARQPGSLEHLWRQGRSHPLAGCSPDGARNRDEPGRPPARRGRGQDDGRSPPGHSVGRADAGLSHSGQPQAVGQTHHPRPQAWQAWVGQEAPVEQISQEGAVRRRAPHEAHSRR